LIFSLKKKKIIIDVFSSFYLPVINRGFGFYTCMFCTFLSSTLSFPTLFFSLLFFFFKHFLIVILRTGDADTSHIDPLTDLLFRWVGRRKGEIQRHRRQLGPCVCRLVWHLNTHTHTHTHTHTGLHILTQKHTHVYHPDTHDFSWTSPPVSVVSVSDITLPKDTHYIPFIYIIHIFITHIYIQYLYNKQTNTVLLLTPYIYDSLSLTHVQPF